jgi:hypothetical protein
MVALTKARSTLKKDGEQYVLPVEAATLIYQGSIVCRNAAGNATKAITATTLQALGRCETTVDNLAGAAGALNVVYRSGCFKFANSAAGDLITNASLGLKCYLVDDQTVALTTGGATRSVAGVIDSVDPDGSVWVWIGVQFNNT